MPPISLSCRTKLKIDVGGIATNNQYYLSGKLVSDKKVFPTITNIVFCAPMTEKTPCLESPGRKTLTTLFKNHNICSQIDIHKMTFGVGGNKVV